MRLCHSCLVMPTGLPLGDVREMSMIVNDVRSWKCSGTFQGYEEGLSGC